MSNSSFKEKVKSSIRIENLISASPALKMPLQQIDNVWLGGATSEHSKSGKSLRVNTEEQYYTNKATGDGGDCFNWIAFERCLDIKKDFIQILHIAADFAGIPYESDSDEDCKQEQEIREIRELLTGAASIYHANLTPELREKIHTKWGITDETIDELKIGYALPSTTFREHSIEVKKLMSAGLRNAITNQEHFQGRIVFPYWNKGSVVNFAARGDVELFGTPDNEYEKGAKYKKLLTHSVKHPDVHESVNNRYLWGEDTIAGNKYCIITEGIADAIILHQNEYPVLSPVTTQFAKKDHERLVNIAKKLETVYICNDNEPSRAGEEGALKTGKLLLKHGVNVKIVTLPSPEGQKVDVAEFFLTYKKEDFDEVIKTSSTLWEFLLKNHSLYFDNGDLIDPEINAETFFTVNMVSVDFEKSAEFISKNFKQKFNLNDSKLKSVISKCKKKKAEFDKSQASLKLEEIKSGNQLYPYELTETGVTKTTTKIVSGKLYTTTEEFMRSPATITGLSIDIDTNTVRYKVNIKNPNTGIKSLWKKPEDLLTRDGIKKMITEDLLITEDHHDDASGYFLKDIVRASKDGTRKELSAATTGWKKNRTVFATGDAIFSVNGKETIILTDEQIRNSIQAHGNIKDWVSGMQWALTNASTRVNCYTVMAAVIAGLIRQPSPILQNKGDTSTGKTLKSLVGLSMVADPMEFMKSLDTTRTGAERRALQTNGYCDVYDEVGLAKQKDLEGLLYMFSNGIGKQRGNITGVDATPRWFKAFILNGEISVLKENAMQGEIGRLIECTEDLEHNTEKVKQTEATFRNNYGLILPLFLEQLFKNIDKIEAYYFHLIKELPEAQIDIGGRLRDSFALLTIAGELLEFVFEDIGIEKMDAKKICTDLYLKNIQSERVKPYWYRSLSMIYDVIMTCKMNETLDDEGHRILTNEFMYKGQVGGEFVDSEIRLEPFTLKQICTDLELKSSGLAEHWNKQKLLKTNAGVNDYSVKRNGNSHKVICLLKNEVEKLLGYNELNNSDNRNQAQINEDFLKERVRKHAYKINMDGDIEDPYASYIEINPNDERRYGKAKILGLMQEMGIEV